MNVLVNGIGNIGTTLLALLVKYKTELGIETIYGFKNAPRPWQDEDLDFLRDLGIIICSRQSNKQMTFVDDIIDDVSYIFDCTSNGGGMRNKEWYVDLPNLIGASAQGSEKDFGLSFMSSVNNRALEGQKFAHIVSCNTHAIGSLLSTFTGDDLSNHESSDFVVVRRSEDLGNHERLVAANVVARHLDDQVGTHHSIDVRDLYATINKSVRVTSSDVTTPSQLMHSVRFNINLATRMSQKQIEEKIAANSYVSTSVKFDSNVIFERGRRIGFQGRIFSHAIIIANNMLITPNSIKGWAFIPQEGNTLLSTLHAFLLQTKHSESNKIMHAIAHDLIYKKW
ncbi:MAG: glyceraldehyde-3-phosphate dehydrogenase/erythrose-4-phosphate dehydrogenase [Flavobacteriaceae bacterium]|jgi:glyceraldehyde-3-phosphate dehydrogenase/erythrose-4-phosphate dehydrogenase